MMLVVLVAGTAILAPNFASTALNAAQAWIVGSLGWFYMLLVGIFIAFTLVVCFTRYGNILLGRDGEKPEFGLLSWFAMFFSAGRGIGLVAIFFITSSDFGSLVIDMLASGGHPNPPVWSRVLFAVLEGILAIALLLAGGLEALQAAALTTALPFGIVMLFMCVATLRSLRVDLARYDRAASRAQYEEVTEQLAENFDETLGEQVDSRVDNRIDYRLARTRGVFNRQAVKEDIRQDVSGRHRRRRERGER